jgi:Ni/Fe-hydrogenase subunit HybB-like protein
MDFTLIAFSAGAFTLACLVNLLNLERFRPVLRLAMLSGWVGYLSVALILVADLGRWDRFWHFMIYPNVHSPMFEISWCLFLYSGVLTLELLPTFFERFDRPKVVRFLHRISVPLVIVGVTLSLLHQSTLGTLYVAMPNRIHPLWYTPLMPALFLISAVGLGLSAVILATLVSSWLFDWKVPTNIVSSLAKGAMWVWLVYLAFKLEHLLGAGLLVKLFSFGEASFWFMVEMVLMVILPIILFALPSTRRSRWGLGIAAASATLGTTLNRFNVTFTAQSVGGIWTIPELANSARYFPSWIESLIQVGILAGAFILWYLAVRHLPILTTRQNTAGS